MHSSNDMLIHRQLEIDHRLKSQKTFIDYTYLYVSYLFNINWL